MKLKASRMEKPCRCTCFSK